MLKLAQLAVSRSPRRQTRWQTQQPISPSSSSSAVCLNSTLLWSFFAGQTGKIVSAGLDVYEREPAINEVLLKNSRALLIPHLGTHTTETLIKIESMAMKMQDEAASGSPCWLWWPNSFSVSRISIEHRRSFSSQDIVSWNLKGSIEKCGYE
jgi:hypothetical protein